MPSLREQVEGCIHVQLKENAARKIVSNVQTWQLNSDQAARRWVGELLQNAFDTAHRSRRQLKVQFNLGRDRLSFIHDGGAFRPEEIAALVLAGSAKPYESPDSIGQFGTGFLVTHAISTRVTLSGLAEGEGALFNLAIDRSGDIDAVSRNIDACFECLANSTPGSDVATVFEYSDLSMKGHEIARSGLAHLAATVPYLFAFNDCLDEIRLTLPQGTEIWARGQRTEDSGDNDLSIHRLSITQQLEERSVHYLVYTFEPLPGSCVAAVVRSDDSGDFFVFPGEQVPKLFRYTPLLDSENAGLSVALHADFAPDIDRSARWISGNPASENPEDKLYQNQKLAEKVVPSIAPFLAHLARLPVCDAHACVHVKLSAGQPSSPWNRCLGALVDQLLKEKIVRIDPKFGGDFKDAYSVAFLKPSLNKLQVEADAFWDIASALGDSLPAKNISSDWTEIISHWEQLGSNADVNWDVGTVLSKARETRTLSGLSRAIQGSDESALDWICDLLELMSSHIDSLPRNVLEGLIPDQTGRLRTPENMYVDMGVDEILKDISDKLRVPLREKLIDSRLGVGCLRPIALDVLNQFVQGPFNSESALKLLVEESRKGLRGNSALRGGGEFPVVARQSARVVAFAAMCRPQYDQILRDLPLLNADDKLESETSNPHCHLPLEAWPAAARVFEDVFPVSGRLHSMYLETDIGTPEEVTGALVAWDRCFPGLVAVHRPLTMRGEIAQKLLCDKNVNLKQSVDYSCLEGSYVPLLDEAIGKIGASRERAAKFLSFIINHVAREDTFWNQLTTVQIDGAVARIRPSLWLGKVLRNKWVPNPHTSVNEDENDRSSPTRDNLYSLITWSDIPADDRTRDLLSLFGFDKLETEINLRSGGTSGSVDALRNELAEFLIEFSSEGVAQARELLEQRNRRREIVENNREYGLAVQGPVRDVLASKGLHVELIDDGYDYLVSDNGEADWENDLARFHLGPYKVEVKAARSSDVRMTWAQARTASENAECYVLCVVDMRTIESKDSLLDQVRSHLHFEGEIGIKLRPLVSNVDRAKEGSEGIRVDQTNQLRFYVSDSVWSLGVGIDEWVERSF